MEVEESGFVEGRLRKICDLFPADQLQASHKSLQQQEIVELAPSKFTKRVNEAVAQIYAQTGRRHKRLAIEDDEFFHADKVQRVEQERRYARVATRFYQAIPARKRPLNSLLRPATALEKSLELKMVDTFPNQLEEKNTFPGSVPVSLMKDDIVSKLWDGAYFFVWAPKTNGLRFLAVFCFFGNKPWILLINRAQQVFALPTVTAPDVLFDGTIFDGELVPTFDGHFAYLAYDCAISCGVPCSEYNYLVRLQIASLIQESWVQRDESMIHWRVKKVWSPEHFADMLLYDLPQLDHDTDGFMATAVEPPIQIGQTQTIFKVKHSTDHTIDFLLVAQPVDQKSPTIMIDLVSLSNRGVGPGESGVWWDTIDVPRNALLPLVKKLGYVGAEKEEEMIKWLSGRVVECRYNPTGKTWVPEIVRHDKAVPNKLSVAEKTWTNIKESLKLTDVFPKGTLTHAQRDIIHQWELAHPHWKPKYNPTPNSKLKHTAPAALSKLITFQ